jgi:ribosomal-protein-alanine N-acetyltransferase
MADVAAAAGFPAWTEERLSAELERPMTRAFVLEHVGLAIGWEVMGELELHLIAVLPSRRRAGVGRALLEAFEGSAEAVHLEVSARDLGALAFYAAAGYAETGRRPGYYPSGHDAVLMTKRRAPRTFAG